ncbi:MAG: hypothetical protein AB1295_05490 [Candidatus Micrarchaeota archaeon]
MTQPSRARSLTYLGIVKDKGLLLNCKAGSLMKDAVLKHGPLHEEFCVATPGSDGRLEKGLKSKLEVVVYHRGMPEEDVDRFAEAVHTAIDAHQCALVANVFTETKDVTMPGAAFLNGDRHMIVPARVMDSFVLCGNPRLLMEAKMQLINDMVGAHAKPIIKELKDKKAVSRKIMQSGRQTWKGETVTHYDLDCGMAYCWNKESDGSTVHLRGFKFGPLRYMQNVLQHDMMMFVRGLALKKRRDEAKEFLSTLPTPTVEKLHAVGALKNSRLSTDELSELADHYGAFLELYHQSESLSNQGITALPFDTAEVRTRITAIARLLENGLFR